MNYVCGFLFSYDLDKFVLIKKNHPEWQKGKWNGVGGKIEPTELICFKDSPELKLKIGDRLHRALNVKAFSALDQMYEFTRASVLEIPQEAMSREFYEETGVLISPRRWKVFHIETYKGKSPDKSADNYTKIYFLAAFGDDWRGVKTDEEVTVWNREDFIWYKDSEVVFNLPYLITMVVMQVANGHFNSLDPEGVNSAFP